MTVIAIDQTQGLTEAGLIISPGDSAAFGPQSRFCSYSRCELRLALQRHLCLLKALLLVGEIRCMVSPHGVLNQMQCRV